MEKCSYPPSTLHQLLCGFVRFMREHNPECPNFLDKSDNRFGHLKGTYAIYITTVMARISHLALIRTHSLHTCTSIISINIMTL